MDETLNQPDDAPLSDEEKLEALTRLFLESDLAKEVQNVYHEHTDVGLSPGHATQAVFQSFRDLLSDPDEGPVIFMALAALQLRGHHLLEPIRDAALALIDSGDAQRAWRQYDATLSRARKQALSELAALLRAAEV